MFTWNGLFNLLLLVLDFFQPSLRDWIFCVSLFPTVETVGYWQPSLRDGAFWVSLSHR